MEYEKTKIIKLSRGKCKKFVKWYKELSNKISNVNYENVIQIKFEDFFQNFNKKKNKLSLKLEIDTNCKDNFDINHTKKNLFKFKKKSV